MKNMKVKTNYDDESESEFTRKMKISNDEESE